MVMKGTQDDGNTLDRTLIQNVVEAMGLFTNDLEIKCEYLFNKLDTHRSPILDKEAFWQRTGFDIRNDQEAIAMVKHHPKLLNKIGSMSMKHSKTHLVRLVDELGIAQIIYDDAQLKRSYYQLKTDYLLTRLRVRLAPIQHTRIFWESVGFTVHGDPHLIALIKKHPSFMAKTEHRNKTVLQRLFEELEMSEFIEEYLEHVIHFTDNLYATDCGTIALKDMSNDDSGISFFRFTTNTNANKDEFCFDDAHSFNLPIIADNMNHTINIYARPKSGSSPLRHIKAIQSDKWMTKYRLNRDKPLNIIESINIEPLDDEYGANGRIHIHCNTEIIINKATHINADMCGMNKDLSLFYRKYNAQKNNELTFGTFADSSREEKMEFETIGNERGGGVIELISQSNIVNNGTLTSNATNADYLD
eukprot:283034_1